MIAPCDDPRCPCETGKPCVFVRCEAARQAGRRDRRNPLKYRTTATGAPLEATHRLERLERGEWVTEGFADDWLAAQRALDKLQNRYGFNYARSVKL